MRFDNTAVGDRVVVLCDDRLSIEQVTRVRKTIFATNESVYSKEYPNWETAESENPKRVLKITTDNDLLQFERGEYERDKLRSRLINFKVYCLQRNKISDNDDPLGTIVDDCIVVELHGHKYEIREVQEAKEVAPPHLKGPKQ